MDYLVLLGIVIVIVGFALKLDSILIIFAAAIVTALVGGIGVDGFLTTLGESFVSNRSMAVFIIILLVVGTLERNGLKDAAAALIGKAKNATPGIIIALYGVMRVAFAATSTSAGSEPAKNAQTGVAASHSTTVTSANTTTWYLSVQESVCLRRVHALAPALNAAMGCRP